MTEIIFRVRHRELAFVKCHPGRNKRTLNRSPTHELQEQKDDGTITSAEFIRHLKSVSSNYFFDTFKMQLVKDI